MPRLARLDAPGILHHVIGRGIERKKIFYNDIDRSDFIDRIAGHLFQNRYKSIVCQEDRYLRELVRYIHLNLLRAGLVKDIQKLNHNPWSGHAALMDKVKREWQGTDYVPMCVAEENELKFEMVRKPRHEGFNEFNPTRIQLVPGDAFAHSGTGGCGIRHGRRAASAFR